MKFLPSYYKLFWVAVAFYIHIQSRIEEDLQVHGIVGWELQTKKVGLILHIGVEEHSRLKGIGSKMILSLVKQYSLRKLICETDKYAVNFYKKCGFKITSLGEKYPGTERFYCELTIYIHEPFST